jgi:hypothetical protein
MEFFFHREERSKWIQAYIFFTLTNEGSMKLNRFLALVHMGASSQYVKILEQHNLTPKTKDLKHVHKSNKKSRTCAWKT